MTDIVNALGPYILAMLGVAGLCTLIFWLLIYSAVRSALRIDREKAEELQWFRSQTKH